MSLMQGMSDTVWKVVLLMMMMMMLMIMIMIIILMQGMSDTVWKVGCYRINPSTPSGQKFFILHMLVLPLIP